MVLVRNSGSEYLPGTFSFLFIFQHTCQGLNRSRIQLFTNFSPTQFFQDSSQGYHTTDMNSKTIIYLLPIFLALFAACLSVPGRPKQFLIETEDEEDEAKVDEENAEHGDYWGQTFHPGPHQLPLVKSNPTANVWKISLASGDIILAGGKIILAGGEIIFAGGKIILAGGKIIPGPHQLPLVKSDPTANVWKAFPHGKQAHKAR